MWKQWKLELSLVSKYLTKMRYWQITIKVSASLIEDNCVVGGVVPTDCMGGKQPILIPTPFKTLGATLKVKRSTTYFLGETKAVEKILITLHRVA